MAAKPKVSSINSANPSFAIEWWDVDRPKDYPLNARKWKPEAVAKVAMSLKTYGWRQPIVIRTRFENLTGKKAELCRT